MFESTAVHRRPHRGFLVLPVSVVLHAAAAGGLLFASVWSVDLPRATPAQVESFHVQPTPPIPPAAPQKASAPKAVEAPAPAARPSEMTAPPEIPDAVPQLAPAGSESDDGDPNSVADDGVPNGERWSVVTHTAPAVEAPRVDPERPMVPGGDVKAPVLTYAPPPVYPRPAIASRVEGEVVVECIIDTSGAVRDVRVVRTSHFLLSPAALEAVQRWRFRPGSFRGRNVATVFQLTVTFKLER